MDSIVTLSPHKKAIREAGEKLTPKQKALVDNLFIPGTTQEEAALAAGYAKTSASVQASRTLRLDHVKEYIATCVASYNAVASIEAVRAVRNLSANAKSEYVQLQAAQDVMDRAGHKPVEKKAVALKGVLNVAIDLSE